MAQLDRSGLRPAGDPGQHPPDRAPLVLAVLKGGVVVLNGVILGMLYRDLLPGADAIAGGDIGFHLAVVPGIHIGKIEKNLVVAQAIVADGFIETMAVAAGAAILLGVAGRINEFDVRKFYLQRFHLREIDINVVPVGFAAPEEHRHIDGGFRFQVFPDCAKILKRIEVLVLHADRVLQNRQGPVDIKGVLRVLLGDPLHAGEELAAV